MYLLYVLHTIYSHIASSNMIHRTSIKFIIKTIVWFVRYDEHLQGLGYVASQCPSIPNWVVTWGKSNVLLTLLTSYSPGKESYLALASEEERSTIERYSMYDVNVKSKQDLYLEVLEVVFIRMQVDNFTNHQTIMKLTITTLLLYHQFAVTTIITDSVVISFVFTKWHISKKIAPTKWSNNWSFMLQVIGNTRANSKLTSLASKG